MENDYIYNYTVIIPHKDCPDLLKRCLDSIPVRNDIQIIVIDDNSNLSDDVIRKLIISDYSYVEFVFTKEGYGAGYARNIGLKKAKGKWILFADADDFYNPDAFDKFDKYLYSDTDIVYFSVNSVYSDTLEKSNRHIFFKKIVSDYITSKKKDEDKLRYSYIVPWGKMINSILIKKHSIEFDEVAAANDMMFSVKTGHYAKKIIADRYQVYCITSRNNSIITKKDRISQRARFEVFIRLNLFFESINRSDLKLRLLTLFFKSLEFGPKEFIFYFKTAINSNANPFYGFGQWMKSILVKDTYTL